MVIGGIGIWMLLNPKTKKNDTLIFPPLKQKPPQETTDEPNKIDDPVQPDPEPTRVPIVPIDETGEMPIKPQPVSCQKAIFRPAPEKYFYTDCCGNYNEGEGYQPWEKRPPISIDVNKPFEGLDLLGEEIEFVC